ncbi:hypothetical protein B0F90DRAFT_1813041 [Multifurca ochricompacta]|uniref:Uncharacterized protein n=1 Tax=Multifurca ochricompacta TaxID=376703 RepID=A0AAD4QT93_9AGAM|nr:hypothetical protein B0F90DRAFT_1813041 [Multifurca ochricompacta]
MLKRQRPSSPLPFVQATETEFPSNSSEQTPTEHGAKRRRIFAPPLDGPSRGWGPLHIEFDDEGDEDNTMEGWSPNPGLEGAGEYKAVNVILHDLHAEQQLRRLSPLSHSCSSLFGTFSSHSWPSPTRQFPLARKPGFAIYPPPHLIQDAPLSESDRQDVHTSDPKGTLHCGEDMSVYERYEETNRFLGSVFLERRRDLSASTG